MALWSLALLASAVLAQSSSNPLIPSGISSGCSAYLAALNSSTTIQYCLTTITSPLALFSPSSNLSSLSSSSVLTALGSLCVPSGQCSQSTITAQLAAFYGNCTVELTSSLNPQVQLAYDALYALYPLLEAVCSKDDDGSYCATKLSNSTAGNAPNTTLLSQDASNSTLVLNATTFQDTNLPFLFLQPDMSTSDLCTTCTRNILSPYIEFESNALYGPGLNHSLLLGGQSALYASILAKCPGDFLNGVLGAASGLSQGIVNGGPPRVSIHELSTAVGAILGVAALVMASL